MTGLAAGTSHADATRRPACRPTLRELLDVLLGPLPQAQRDEAIAQAVEQIMPPQPDKPAPLAPVNPRLPMMGRPQ